jgi:outer membrane lipoprotein-sorting protein
MRAPGTRQRTYTHVHYTRERISAPPRWTRDPNAKVNGRVCSCVQVVHPVPRRNFRFHLARVFIDDELLIPIRYEAYDWPHEEGGQPVLMEEYTYMNVKINNGFTDADFDPKNTAYKFNAK